MFWFDGYCSLFLAAACIVSSVSAIPFVRNCQDVKVVDNFNVDKVSVWAIAWITSDTIIVINGNENLLEWNVSFMFVVVYGNLVCLLWLPHRSHQWTKMPNWNLRKERWRLRWNEKLQLRYQVRKSIDIGTYAN